MKTVIHNIINGEFIPEAYEKIAQKLGESGYKAEECYTYECICRLYRDDEEKKLIYETKIKDLNADKCQNSYDMFKMYQSTIDFEFPLYNSIIEDKIIYHVNRYLALLHIFLIKEVYNDTELLKEMYSAGKAIKAIIGDSLKFVENNDFKNQIQVLTSQEELKAAEIIQRMKDDIEFSKIAIEYGYKQESIYLRILTDYVDAGEYTEAIDFFNTYCLSVCKAEEIQTKGALLDYLSSRLYCYGQFCKSLEYKREELADYLNSQGELNE